jgi:hypothetical protein
MSCQALHHPSIHPSIKIEPKFFVIMAIASHGLFGILPPPREEVEEGKLKKGNANAV